MGRVRQGPSKRTKAEVSGSAEGEEEMSGNSKCIPLRHRKVLTSYQRGVCAVVKIRLAVSHARPPENPAADVLVHVARQRRPPVLSTREFIYARRRFRRSLGIACETVEHG